MIGLFRSARSILYTCILRRIARSCGTGVRANGLVLGRNLVIGNDCHFNGMRVFGRGCVSIGDNFHSGRGLQVLTEIHDYHGSRLPYDDNVIVRDVSIGRNVWVGVDVRILGGVSIGEGAIVQAGSTVVSDISPLDIVGGHPAKPFKKRDVEHYVRISRQAGK